MHETMPDLLEVSKRHHNFGTKRFKEKSLFIFHARIALKSLILLFVRLIARGARIGKTQTQTHRQNKYCNPRACAPRVNYEHIHTLLYMATFPMMIDIYCLQTEVSINNYKNSTINIQRIYMYIPSCFISK